jgi:hypothetical protein
MTAIGLGTVILVLNASTPGKGGMKIGTPYVLKQQPFVCCSGLKFWMCYIDMMLSKVDKAGNYSCPVENTLK